MQNHFFKRLVLKLNKYKLITGILIVILSALYSCSSQNKSIDYIIHENKITVDGETDDWKSISGNQVADPDFLWFGQGMVRENWKGAEDLSFEWKACWSEKKLYFLFNVKDDILVDPAQQPNSFLNDCVEILLDYKNQKGERFVDTEKGIILRGYEMHFLPSTPNHVFFDDALAPLYPLNMAQDSIFNTEWKGEIICNKNKDSYCLEIGFEIPGFTIERGKTIGLDVDVCDDDGEGRKSLLIWSGTKNKFWETMDEYPQVIFK